MTTRNLIFYRLGLTTDPATVTFENVTRPLSQVVVQRVAWSRYGSIVHSWRLSPPFPVGHESIGHPMVV